MTNITNTDVKSKHTKNPLDIQTQSTADAVIHLTPPEMTTPAPSRLLVAANVENNNKVLIIAASSLILAMGFLMGLMSDSFANSAIITTLSLVTLLAAYYWTRNKVVRKDVYNPDDAAQKAEAANAAKTHILAIASHEMRTPLNGILGMAKLLDETQLSPEQQNYNDAIKTSGDALFAFVEDMLDITRIETGHFDLTPTQTNIRDELENICELLAPRAHEKNLELASITQDGVPSSISIDSRRLRQVLVNLLGNALKFTKNGGVSLRAKLVGGNTIRFEIADTGPGIDDKNKQKVFEEFEQIDLDITRKFGGAGLGLAISKAIVEKMNGTINISDNTPSGTVFAVDIPLRIEKNGSAEVNPDKPICQSQTVISIISGDMEAPIIDEMIKQTGRSSRLISSLSRLDEIALNNEDAIIIIEEALISDDFKLGEKFHNFKKMIVLLEPSSRRNYEKYQKLGFSSYLIRPLRRKSLEMILDQEPDVIPVTSNTGNNIQHIKMPVGARKNILLVEDNAINSLLATKVLERSGHQVTLAENGKLASELFRDNIEDKTPFDLVYMDLHMPVMDGLTAIGAMRETEKEFGLDSTRIVALSADEQTQTREEVSLAGANGFLSKPFDPIQLSQDAIIDL